MESHVKATGILWIAKGILGLLIGFFVLALLIGIGIFVGAESGEEIVLPILVGVSVFVAAILGFLAIPEIIAGIGILKHKNWARILGLIVAALNLIDIPFGTALGIYTFWVLLKDETEKLFS